MEHKPAKLTLSAHDALREVVAYFRQADSTLTMISVLELLCLSVLRFVKIMQAQGIPPAEALRRFRN